MLPHLLQVGQGGALPLHQRGHAPQGSPLELLAAVQAVAVLQQAHIVLADAVDQVAAHVELPQGKLVMVLQRAWQVIAAQASVLFSGWRMDGWRAGGWLGVPKGQGG